jgi:uncharacterized protein
MVHTFSALGCYIAVDVNSGAVHVLDKLSYDLLTAAGENAETMPTLPGVDQQQAEAAWQELMVLKDQGLLFTPMDYVDPAEAVPKDAPVKALCLHVSHDCNLRCKYCFASTGDFGTGRKIMPPEVALRAIDWVVEKSGKRHNIEVDFFGGEPMMALDTVKATVDYARAHEQEWNKHFRFTMTTNGVLLDDENTKYFNDTMDNCVLSLDGRREVNDRNRLTVNGKGSYDVIVPKFLKLIQQRDKSKDYYVRGTFTRDNLDFSNDVLSIADLGVDSISVEPVTAADSDPYSLREQDLPTIFAEYEKLAKIMLQRKDFNFFHFNVDLSQGPCVIKRMRGCGAGCEYVAVTPDGDLYPCHQFVGKEEYRMGSVLDGEFRTDIADTFAGLNIYTREDCQTCWARFYCSGGCSAANLNANGDMKKPYRIGCEMQKKRLECAIAMKAIDAGIAEMPE